MPRQLAAADFGNVLRRRRSAASLGPVASHVLSAQRRRTVCRALHDRGADALRTTVRGRTAALGADHRLGPVTRTRVAEEGRRALQRELAAALDCARLDVATAFAGAR